MKNLQRFTVSTFKCHLGHIFVPSHDSWWIIFYFMFQRVMGSTEICDFSALVNNYTLKWWEVASVCNTERYYLILKVSFSFWEKLSFFQRKLTWSEKSALVCRMICVGCPSLNFIWYWRLICWEKKPHTQKNKSLYFSLTESRIKIHVLATFLFLWWDTMTKSNYRRKSLMGLQFYRVSHTWQPSAGNITTHRQTWHWSISK